MFQPDVMNYGVNDLSAATGVHLVICRRPNM